MVDLDRVYRGIGELGRAQWEVSGMVFLLAAYNAWHMLQYTFVGHPVAFECRVGGGGGGRRDDVHVDHCPDGQEKELYLAAPHVAAGTRLIAGLGWSGLGQVGNSINRGTRLVGTRSNRELE